MVLELAIVGAVFFQVTPAASPPAAVEEIHPVWRMLERLYREQALGAELDLVLEHLRAMVKTRIPGGRLDKIADALANPWMAPQYSRELRDFLCAPLSPPHSFEDLWRRVAEYVDEEKLFEDPSSGGDPLIEKLESHWRLLQAPELVELELLEKLSEFVALAHDVLAELLQALDEDEKKRFFHGHEAASEGWYRSHFPKASEEELRPHTESMDSFRRVALRVDRLRALRVGAVIARLAEPAFQATLATRLARTPRSKGTGLQGVRGDVVTVVGVSPESRVVLGGRGRTQYQGPFALIIDLGGDDVYERAAVVDDPSCMVSVVVDVLGNDRYECKGEGPAYSLGGVAVLVDRKGDDHYLSGRHGQAVSASGFAFLLDEEGDDHYEAADYSQAYEYCGFAFLYDMKGKDSYSGWSYCQGSGNGSGFSALVDGGGDDQYLADLKWPDVYGDSGPNIYHGAAQGFNLGFRGTTPEVAGGFAALIDRSGNDRYQAGNFSQGGGYYFGFGLMYDGEGDDKNFGSRYSQGFGVHQAVGVRWDVQGDDEYHPRCAANCGSGWDEGVGWLIDEQGDDLYDCGGLALGGAAQTAFAILFDGEGKDTYRSGGGNDSQGGAGGSEYHNKPSIGFLLDLGGDKDSFSRPGNEDNKVIHVAGHGLFCDSKARTTEQLLESKPGRK